MNTKDLIGTILAIPVITVGIMTFIAYETGKTRDDYMYYKLLRKIFIISLLALLTIIGILNY